MSRCVKLKDKQKQFSPVDDQKLVVVTNQVVRGARHRNAGCEEAHLQFPQIPLTAAIGVRDQRVDKHPSRGGVGQSLFDFGTVEPKNGDLHAAFGSIDGFHQWRDPVAGLYQQFQN